MKPEDFIGNDFSMPVEADTLTGDLRDAILQEVRSIRVPWAMLNEEEQRNVVFRAESCAQDIIRRAVSAIAVRGFPAFAVTTGKWTVNDGMKLEVSAPGSSENIEKLASHGKGPAVLVLSQASDFFGERAPVKIRKDEPGLPLDGDD